MGFFNTKDEEEYYWYHVIYENGKLIYFSRQEPPEVKENSIDYDTGEFSWYFCFYYPEPITPDEYKNKLGYKVFTSGHFVDIIYDFEKTGHKCNYDEIVREYSLRFVNKMARVKIHTFEAGFLKNEEVTVALAAFLPRRLYDIDDKGNGKIITIIDQEE